jgi:site-specific DNA recombinase
MANRQLPQPNGDQPRAALYARVSSQHQAEKDLSIPSQLKLLRQYATDHGFLVYREYVDEARSGRTDQRAAFQDLIAEAKRKDSPFQVILCWKFSRFARSREDSVIYKSLLRKRGIQVISVSEPVDDTPAGFLLEGILECVDEFYSKNLAVEVMRGLREAVKQGRRPGGNAPFGYRYTLVQNNGQSRKVLEPDGERAGIVREIFQLHQDNHGVKSIASLLNRRPPEARGYRTWNGASIHKLLTNPVYTGDTVWNRTYRNGPLKNQPKPKEEWVVAEKTHPAVVSTDVFEAVQKRLGARAPAVRPPAEVGSSRPLSGLIKCGVCGSKFVAKYGYGKLGKRYDYYSCSQVLWRGTDQCTNRRFPAGLLEQTVTSRVKEVVFRPEVIREVVDMVNERLALVCDECRDELAEVERALGRLEEQQERYYRAIEQGKLDLEVVNRRLHELKNEENELLQKRARLQETLADDQPIRASDDEIVRHVRELVSLLEVSSPKALRGFLETFIQKVEIFPDGRIDIYYFPPLEGLASLSRVAERVGFEPTRELAPPTRFPVAPLRPTRASLRP